MAAVIEAPAVAAADFADTVDGAELVSDEALPEETFSSDDGSKTTDPFALALQELEVLLMDEAFNERVDAFSTQHCGEFEPGDENKLIYTTLFNEYSSMLESYIEERLGASIREFDMDGFCATLAERAKREEPLPQSLEMLHSMADFDAFKEMMLSAKVGLAVEAESGAFCVSGEPLRLETSGVGAVGLPGLGDDDEGGEELVGVDLAISGLKVG